jgi:hypothetical protein
MPGGYVVRDATGSRSPTAYLYARENEDYRTVLFEFEGSWKSR